MAVHSPSASSFALNWRAILIDLLRGCQASSFRTLAQKRKHADCGISCSLPSSKMSQQLDPRRNEGHRLSFAARFLFLHPVVRILSLIPAELARLRNEVVHPPCSGATATGGSVVDLLGSG